MPSFSDGMVIARLNRACYGLYADYYWYEIADTICIGDNQRLYYCFPKGRPIVAKTRLAAEELYKFCKARRKNGQPLSS